MTIETFTEKEIRNAIKKKIKPTVNKGRAKHDKGIISVNDKKVARVKIPNAHSRPMHKNKSQYIATALKISHEEFNDLVRCPLTGTEYYKILEGKI